MLVLFTNFEEVIIMPENMNEKSREELLEEIARLKERYEESNNEGDYASRLAQQHFEMMLGEEQTLGERARYYRVAEQTQATREKYDKDTSNSNYSERQIAYQTYYEKHLQNISPRYTNKELETYDRKSLTIFYGMKWRGSEQGKSSMNALYALIENYYISSNYDKTNRRLVLLHQAALNKEKSIKSLYNVLGIIDTNPVRNFKYFYNNQPKIVIALFLAAFLYTRAHGGLLRETFEHTQEEMQNEFFKQKEKSSKIDPIKRVSKSLEMKYALNIAYKFYHDDEFLNHFF
jgi:hypothetical protein